MNPAAHFNPISLPPKKLVLLVEDDQESALLQRKIIERAGGEVHLERTVSGALQYLERSTPDLVLTDLNFPDESLSGFDFLLHRSGAASAGPAVIVVSGRNDSDSLEDALRLGAAGYIAKPFLPMAYERHISQAMSDLKVRAIPMPPADVAVLPWEGKIFDHTLTVFEAYLLASLAASLLFGVYASVIHTVMQTGGWFFQF